MVSGTGSHVRAARMVSVTGAEIKAICEEWGRGEHFPVKDLDEESVKAAMSAEPERWWKVLQAVIEEAPMLTTA